MNTIHTPMPTGRVRNRGLKDYSGTRFGRLVAVALVERDEDRNNHIWRFACDCGATTDKRIKNVSSGHTRSCGCLHRDITTARNYVHGFTKSEFAAYRSWKDMRGRCRNPKNSDYKDYGGRGISVCERWEDFAAFLADMGSRPDRTTLDRIDVNGDYTPENCRWANAKQQANNKRSNHLIEMNGETRTLQSWCTQFGLEPSKVRYRLKRGWPLVKAFSLGDFRSEPNAGNTDG